ncbi:MAG: GtrA family protein [Actinomycetia bacterium]|nr:GtrA family protein [Actinomycetes bacterium]
MTFANKQSLFQAMKVAIVGVFNTIVSFALFNVFLVLLSWSWFPSITVSFTVTTFMSYLINRRWTFELRDSGVSGRETASFFGVNLLAYVASVAIMWIAEALFGPLTAIGSNLALLFAAGLLILPKLAGYRDVVFGRALAEQDHAIEPSTT